VTFIDADGAPSFADVIFARESWVPPPPETDALTRSSDVAARNGRVIVAVNAPDIGSSSRRPAGGEDPAGSG
jgi:hypothetical protein